MSGTLAWQQPGLRDACQSSKMAILFNALLFLFRISLLSDYREKYYDCIIVMWCGGVACNLYVSLDISLVLALKLTYSQYSAIHTNYLISHWTTL